MARENLIYNPSFSGGLQGWASVNGSIISITRQFSHHGSYSLRVDLGGAAGSGVQTAQNSLIPVTAGLPYVLSAYTLIPTFDEEPTALVLSVYWYDASGTVTYGAPQYFSPVQGPDWTRVALFETAPAGAVYARISITSQLANDAVITNSLSGARSYVGVTPTEVPYTDSTLPWDGSHYVVLDPDGVPYVQSSLTGNGVGDLQVSVAPDDVPFVLSSPGDVFVDAILFEQSTHLGTFVDNLTPAQVGAIADTALRPANQTPTSKMQLKADIIIGDLLLNVVDDFGVVWVCTDIEGWWGHSTPEIPDIARGVEDGSYDVTGRYTARQLTLTGVILPPHAGLLPAARDRLIAATNLVRKGAWLRTSENPTRASFVRLSGRPMIQTVNARGRTEFSIGLRAADPVKYEWNEEDNGGLTVVTSQGTNALVADNIGTADVTTIIEVTGPSGAGSTVYNAATDETLTILSPLRRAGLIGHVSKAERYDNIATLTTDHPHTLLVGDTITVSGVGEPYDSATSASYYTVTSAASTYPYTFTYDLPGDVIRPVTVAGLVSLRTSDVLSIDTYSRSVSFNGTLIGHRGKIDTLVDWIKLAPGKNPIDIDDSIDPYQITTKEYTTKGVATLTTADAHFMRAGEKITVQLASTVPLAFKQLTANVVTLTTSEPHGFSTGDLLDVDTAEVSGVTNKALISNVVTLTTTETGSFAPSDIIEVALKTSAKIARKSRINNLVTLTTLEDHGFSALDSVTVDLPTSAVLVKKAIASNLASLSTTTAHGFSAGDLVTVTLPTTAMVIRKDTAGAMVTLTTSADHGFSKGDAITVAFPVNAVISSRSLNPAANSGTIVTPSAHNYTVGDLVSINVGITPTVTVTRRQATTTTCVLTTSTTHNFSVGEEIQISGVGTAYNGTAIITAVSASAKTITYTRTVAGLAEASVASTGTVLNRTIGTGYNGTRVVETIPTATSFTYIDYTQTATTTSSTGTGTVVNETNKGINGTMTIGSVPSATRLTYTKVETA